MGFSEDFQGLRWMIPRGYHVKRGVILERGGIFQILVLFFVNLLHTNVVKNVCDHFFVCCNESEDNWSISEQKK